MFKGSKVTIALSICASLVIGASMELPQTPSTSADITWTNGKIGIGINNPVAPLSIQGSSYGFMQMGQNGYQPFNIAASATSFWIFQNGRNSITECFRMDNLGNVYIGAQQQTTPQYKLSVNGKIRAKEVKVEAVWSDFVFKPDYKLRTLDEVETFIKKNGHLPEVPSEKVVKKEGVALGKMQSTLLQKIEELTLYVIEQQKMIDSQTVVINNLTSNSITQ